jgi:L-malate glycosyltransferase
MDRATVANGCELARPATGVTVTGHILHVFPTFSGGGAQSRVVSIIKSLESQGRLRLKHTIVALDGNHEAGKALQNDTNVKYVDGIARGSLGQVFALASLYRSVRPNLIITYNWGAMDAVIAAKLTRICPVVHTEDGFGVDEAETLKTRRILMRRVLLNTILLTVVPSRSLESIALNRYRLQRKKVRLIVNGVDTGRFFPGRNQYLRRQLNIPDESVVIGSVGQLRPEKNLMMLFRAFEPLATRNTKLLILGDGLCRRDLETMATDRGLMDSVVFTGAVPDPAPYYRAMDVFAMSSVTEQMPMALLEAMATGLPAVCTGVGDIPTMLEENPAEVVRGGKEEGYVAALRTMTERPDLRAELGRRNRSRCTAKYSLEQMIAEYSRIYDRGMRQQPA